MLSASLVVPCTSLENNASKLADDPYVTVVDEALCAAQEKMDSYLHQLAVHVILEGGKGSGKKSHRRNRFSKTQLATNSHRVFLKLGGTIHSVA